MKNARQLDSFEKEILAKKAGRMNREFNVEKIEYRTAFPRTTVCILYGAKIGSRAAGETALGITMRGKKEPENEKIGNVQAFVRAVNGLVL